MTATKDKILIADDMETFLRLEKMLLERSGFDIIMAKSGSEAIKKIQLEKPKIVFLDLLMPDMNGDVVCRFIKSNKALKHIPVVMVTTKSEPEYRERCLQAGCDDYITKPVTQRDLFEKIKKFIPVERRVFPRVILSITVTTTGKSFSFTEFAYDVSEGGVFLKTDTPLDANVNLDLVFSLHNEETSIHAQGKVVHCQTPAQTKPGGFPGMGIQFTSISPADVGKIRNYIEKNRG
jgi:uncharacterized protein (TIGR02266 family)